MTQRKKRTRHFLTCGMILLGLIGLNCQSGGNDDDSFTPPPAATNWQRDIIDTALVIDLADLSGTAVITLAPAGTATAASFEAEGLSIDQVYCSQGPLNYAVNEGRLDVGIPATGSDFALTVDYRFSVQSNYDGYLASGVTFIWPYFCGNLFPCHSDPSDGLTFSLNLLNPPAATVAVYPSEIPAEAPSYQIAWAVGDYTWHPVATTTAGTEIGVWSLPETESTAASWNQMPLVFDWCERTLGPYRFGGKAGSVAVIWGAGGYGGMEHHPFWHIAKPAMGDPAVHTHESCHGWYGDGIRIRCWEDFVLSEGTVTYLTARGTGQAVGAAEEAQLWAEYEADLTWILNHDDGIAWPDSCGEVDILKDGLFSLVPYIKGAYFYRAVANEIGADVLDEVLASFYLANAGNAARMQDMLDHILSQTSFDATELANGWLRSLGRPDQAKADSRRQTAVPTDSDDKPPFPLDNRTWRAIMASTTSNRAGSPGK
jgi:hypothetical protein